jgi:hypothetical protein
VTGIGVAKLAWTAAAVLYKFGMNNPVRKKGGAVVVTKITEAV